MLTVNGHTYNIDADACLRAYFLEKIGWYSISGSREFTHEERATFFGPDCNRRNMREVRMSPEWVGIVTQFAQEHGIDVQDAIRKAIYIPRGPRKKHRKAKPASAPTPAPAPAPTTDNIKTHVVHSLCNNQAETESDVQELRKLVLEAYNRIDTLGERVFELETKEDRVYRLVPVEDE